MDPNENLREQLKLANRILATPYGEDSFVSETDARDLAELVIGLNEWITKGGFLPAAWSKSRG